MLFSSTSFIGIDPTAGEKPFYYVALDQNLELIATCQGDIEDALAFAAGQEQAYLAICAPQRPNQGVMRREDVRQKLTPPPQPGRWMDFRLAEYLLRRCSIRIPKTPKNEKECPNWIRVGFRLYRRLEELGYKVYPVDGAKRQYLEVYPHASYTVLLGVPPLPKKNLEGRLQRQLALFEKGLNIPDPMHFFEEITRHRLLKGVLPLEDLRSPGELDALVAAYTAWMAATKPAEVTLLGDPQEGQVVLPVSEMKKKY